MSNITKIAEIRPGQTEFNILAKVIGDIETSHIYIKDKPYDQATGFLADETGKIRFSLLDTNAKIIKSNQVFQFINVDCPVKKGHMIIQSSQQSQIESSDRQISENTQNDMSKDEYVVKNQGTANRTQDDNRPRHNRDEHNISGNNREDYQRGAGRNNNQDSGPRNNIRSYRTDPGPGQGRGSYSNTRRGDDSRRGDDTRRGDDSRRGDDTRRGDDSRRGDDTRRGDSNRRGDDNRRGDSNRRGDDNRRGDSNRRGDDNRRGDSNRRGDDTRRGEEYRRGDNTRRRDDSRRSDSNRRGEDNRRGDSNRRSDDNRKGETYRRGDNSRRLVDSRRGDDTRRGDSNRRGDSSNDYNSTYRPVSDRNRDGSRSRNESNRNSQNENPRSQGNNRNTGMSRGGGNRRFANDRRKNSTDQPREENSHFNRDNIKDGLLKEIKYASDAIISDPEYIKIDQIQSQRIGFFTEAMVLDVERFPSSKRSQQDDQKSGMQLLKIADDTGSVYLLTRYDDKSESKLSKFEKGDIIQIRNALLQYNKAHQRVQITTQRWSKVEAVKTPINRELSKIDPNNYDFQPLEYKERQRNKD